MKIVGVISSPHREGNSATLVRHALEAAAREGASVHEVFLAQHRVELCNGCAQCLRTGRCAIRDDFEALKALLADADGIVLSSPTYGGAPCARMKNLFDRLGQLSFLSAFVGGKYVAAIATAGGFGAAATARQLGAVSGASVLQRARLSGTLGVLLHGRHVSAMPAALEKASRLGRRLARDIARRRRYPLQSLGTRAFYRLLLAPAIRKYARAQREGALKGVYNELVRKGLLTPAA